jgi:hypothetical protein
LAMLSRVNDHSDLLLPCSWHCTVACHYFVIIRCPGEATRRKNCVLYEMSIFSTYVHCALLKDCPWC